MPSLTKHQSRKVTKLLNIGEPGAGKTGALVCLAKAGYRLVIADFDNKLDILSNILSKEAPDKVANITFETFTDPLQMVNGKMIPIGTPKAFTKGMEALTRWKFGTKGESDYYDLGNISTWDESTIFVLDSLGFMGVAALRLCRQMNGRQLERAVDRRDYGQAMEAIEGVLQMLHSDSIKCHVIVNTHITYKEDELTEVNRGFPRALGSQLPPKVGGYFNSVIRTLSEGSGSSTRHVIKTVSEPALELHVPVAPGILSKVLPIETGLLTIFKALQKEEWVDPATRVEKAEPTQPSSNSAT